MKAEKKFKWFGLASLLICTVLSLFGIMDAGAMCATTVPLSPTTGDGIAEHGGNGDTVQFGNENVDEFIKKGLDDVLIKLEPYNTALETMTRKIDRTRKVNSQEWEYYTQGYLPIKATLNAAVTAGAQADLDLGSYNGNIAVNETLIVLGVPGYLPGTTTQDPERDLVLVVVDRNAGKPTVKAVNGLNNNPAQRDGGTIPAIPVTNPTTSQPQEFARSMRAGSEKQIRTDIFTSMPQKRIQYLQKALCEIEMSTFFEMADKEVKFTFSDATERALLEYKRENNVAYWKGVKAKLLLANKYRSTPEETYFTEGIWYQPPTGNDFDFAGTAPTANSLIDLHEKVFSAPSSSDTKVWFCSTEQLSALQKVEWNSNIYLGDRVDFMDFRMTRLISNFGETLLFHSKDMNEAGLATKGLIMDVNYLQKLTMGYRAFPINNAELGIADSKSYVVTEPSAVILRVPESAFRIHL
jgi:hypothetical protein